MSKDKDEKYLHLIKNRQKCLETFSEKTGKEGLKKKPKLIGIFSYDIRVKLKLVISTNISY